MMTATMMGGVVVGYVNVSKRTAPEKLRDSDWLPLMETDAHAAILRGCGAPMI